MKRPSMPYPTMGFFLAYMCLALCLLSKYFLWDANLYLGLLLAPYICRVDQKQKSLRYLLPALIALILALLLPVKTMLFIALLFSVMLLVENSIGKLSEELLFLLLLISPVFKHITRLAEFPVKLWLSDQVATLLNFSGIDSIASGNQIVMAHYEFSVDPACAGLNMLVTSLIIFLFILAHYQRLAGKQFHFLHILILSIVTVSLNIVCNFFRILLLVSFKIMPGTFFHDFTGICCLIIYVILPLMKGIKPLLTWLGKERKNDKPENLFKRTYSLRYPLLHGLFLTTLIFIGLHMVKADSLMTSAKTIHLKKYNKQELEGGILKFENKEALIYLKPTAFYAPEHDPKICWTGSGYQFKNISKEFIGGIEVYTAVLQKGKDRIYSAWWFDNGAIKTINQFNWRWHAAKGESPFYLVNINAATPMKLREKAADLLFQTSVLNQQ